METRERPPPMSEKSMACPLGGTDGDPRVPTPMLETSMMGLLGGADGDPGAPTTYVGDIDGGPPKRR
jgi:hypothetical protein